VDYLALFVSLPTTASTDRTRVWRALKGLGCATLRDGVYLIPDGTERAALLEPVAADAVASGGNAEIFRLAARDDGQQAALRALFDRSAEYAAIVADARALSDAHSDLDAAVATRKMQALSRRLDQVTGSDFFPGEARRQALAELDALRATVSRRLSPGEPTAGAARIVRLDPGDFRRRVWATRSRPWVDRLASAWLIRRCIDPEARIEWIAASSDCRPEWVGFDFDGATFSHVGHRVTFETLLATFGLDSDPSLARLGQLVHSLDVGGLPVAEAAGVETLLTGLRATESDDDTLLERAMEVFDWVLAGIRGQLD
jgi:hypothetical protein